MNFILFHGKIESINHFTDELVAQLHQMEHKTYVLDLNDPEKMEQVGFLNRFDAAICYDCIGTFSQVAWRICGRSR